jgi:hypothetical protein
MAVLSVMKIDAYFADFFSEMSKHWTLHNWVSDPINYHECCVVDMFKMGGASGTTPGSGGSSAWIA